MTYTPCRLCWMDHPDMPHAYRLLVRVDDSGETMHVGGVCEDTEGPGMCDAPPGAAAWWWVGQRPVDGANALTLAWGWATSHDDAERIVAVVAEMMSVRGVMMDTETERDFVPAWED